MLCIFGVGDFNLPNQLAEHHLLLTSQPSSDPVHQTSPQAASSSFSRTVL